MSGGSGKRLWPLSRALYPKQFVQIKNELSYFQKTLLRLDKKIFHTPSVICNHEHRFMVKEQAKSIDQSISNIFLEPKGRNTTAPSILAALSCSKDDLILLMPSDHVILNNRKFNESIKNAIKSAINGKIILFGVKPTKPETGYGYISVKKGKNLPPYEIVEFIEKPSNAKAKKLYNSSLTYWNSGLFLFKASKLIEESKKYCPSSYKHTLNAYKKRKYDGEYYFVDEENFLKNKDISIDYSVMQKSNSLMMCKLLSNWKDMGSWDSYWDYFKKDARKNYIIGENYSENCKNSLIISDKQLTVTIGVENLIIASLSDSLLVMDRKHSNKLSGIIKKMEQKKQNELINSPKCYRPWGSYESLKSGLDFQIKEIIVNPNSAISLQKHKKRSEHWVIINGTATVTKGNRKIQLKKNQSIDIKVGEMHRLENKTNKELRIIEIQTGKYLGEDDIIRYKDDYKRV